MASRVKFNTEKGTYNFEIQTRKAQANKNNINLSGSSLDWYKLTENTRHVLSQIVSGSIQLQFEEMQKANPDEDKLEQLEQQAYEVIQISRDAKNFKSQSRMLEIIEKYKNFEFAQ